MKLLVNPFIFGVFCTAIWHFVQAAGGFPQAELRKADAGIMSSGVVTFLIFGYGLFAVSMFSQAWSDWRNVKKAVRKKDEELFNEHVDEHIPTPAKLLLLVGECSLISAFFLAYFESSIDGYFAIFAVTFFVALVWEAIMDFNDYFTGVWNVDINEVPNDWAWAQKNKPKIMGKLWREVTNGVLPESVEPR